MYTVITSREQYREYTGILRTLLLKEEKTADDSAAIDDLSYYIRAWNKQKYPLDLKNPGKIVKGLLAARGLKNNALLDVLKIKKAYLSELLNGVKPFTKDHVRDLARYFDVPQEILNPEAIPEPEPEPEPQPLGEGKKKPEKVTDIVKKIFAK